MKRKSSQHTPPIPNSRNTRSSPSSTAAGVQGINHSTATTGNVHNSYIPFSQSQSTLNPFEHPRYQPINGQYLLPPPFSTTTTINGNSSMGRKSVSPSFTRNGSESRQQQPSPHQHIYPPTSNYGASPQHNQQQHPQPQSYNLPPYHLPAPSAYTSIPPSLMNTSSSSPFIPTSLSQSRQDPADTFLSYSPGNSNSRASTTPVINSPTHGSSSNSPSIPGRNSVTGSSSHQPAYSYPFYYPQMQQYTQPGHQQHQQPSQHQQRQQQQQQSQQHYQPSIAAMQPVQSSEALMKTAKTSLDLADMLDPIFETIEFLIVTPFKSNYAAKTGTAGGSHAIMYFNIDDRVYKLITMNDYYYVTLDLFKPDLSHPLNFKNFDLNSLQLNSRECFSLLPKMNTRLEKKATRFSKKTVASSPFSLGPDLLLRGANSLIMSTKTPLDSVLIVRLVKRRSVGDLVQIVKNRPNKKSISSKTQSYSTDDDVIEEQGEAIPLRDPLTMSRMITPARGLKCTHQSCFDLTSYLEYAYTSKSWLCPCCQSYLPFSELIVDDVMTKALERPESHRFDKVVILPNDQFEYLHPNDQDDDDDSESEDDTSELDLNAVPTTPKKKRKAEIDENIVVIDLD